MDFAGKVALVTGGGGGIGGAMATELASRGARVAVADFAIERAEETVARIEAAGHSGMAVALKLDVTSQADFDAARTAIEARWGARRSMPSSKARSTYSRITTIVTR